MYQKTSVNENKLNDMVQIRFSNKFILNSTL